MGRFEGIFVAWNIALFEVVDHRIGEYSVSIFVKNIADQREWVLLGVYGSCEFDGINLLCSEFASVQNNWGGCRGVWAAILMLSGIPKKG